MVIKKIPRKRVF